MNAFEFLKYIGEEIYEMPVEKGLYFEVTCVLHSDMWQPFVKFRVINCTDENVYVFEKFVAFEEIEEFIGNGEEFAKNWLDLVVAEWQQYFEERNGT